MRYRVSVYWKVLKTRQPRYITYDSIRELVKTGVTVGQGPIRFQVGMNLKILQCK